MAIFDLDPSMVAERQLGTKENIEKAKEEFESLSRNILAVLADY